MLASLMTLRKAAHWAPKVDRAYLIEDINEWVREVTKDPNGGLPEDTKMTVKELAVICRAIIASKFAK